MSTQSNFDEVIDRRQVATLKYRGASMEQIFGESDLFPSWVADMDFKVSPAIIAAFEQRVAHGVFGYEYRPGSLLDAIVGWCETRHGWTFDRTHLLFSPSVLNTISVIVNLFTETGDGVIVQPPVFFDFKLILNKNQRQLVKNPLILENGCYRMDLEDLRVKASNPKTKLLILCNPHNPVGRVWSREELEEVVDICRHHDVLVLADELHGDIVYEGYCYTPFASLSEDSADMTFTCLSPAKTFNIAGCTSAISVIANDAYRRLCADFYDRLEINKNNAFANVAMEAAYRKGAEWLEQVLLYLEANVKFLRDYLLDVPGVSLVEPEGTFLIWLDFRDLGLEVPALQRLLVQQARLGISMGHWFGREGAGFARLNIACPRSELRRALCNLKTAVTALSE